MPLAEVCASDTFHRRRRQSNVLLIGENKIGKTASDAETTRPMPLQLSFATESQPHYSPRSAVAGDWR